MTLSVETLLIVSLMMAVFAAVSTVGSSLFLGAGFERLRAGFESIKKQTAFFSEQIHKLDGRVDAVEKQSGYFFEAITNLEQDAVQAPDRRGDVVAPASGETLICAHKSEAQNVDLITASGFIVQADKRKLSDKFSSEAHMPQRAHFH